MADTPETKGPGKSLEELSKEMEVLKSRYDDATRKITELAQTNATLTAREKEIAKVDNTKIKQEQDTCSDNTIYKKCHKVCRSYEIIEWYERKHGNRPGTQPDA